MRTSIRLFAIVVGTGFLWAVFRGAAHSDNDAVAQEAAKQSRDEAAPAPDSYVREVTPEDKGPLNDLGLEFELIEIKAPVNARCTVWTAMFRHGKLVREFSQGHVLIPPVGKAICARFRWSKYSPPAENPQSPKRVRIAFAYSDGSSETSAGEQWTDEPFPREINDTSSEFRSRVNMEFGKTYTVWVRRGKAVDLSAGIRSESELADKTIIENNDVAVFIKCRIDPADPDRAPYAHQGDVFLAQPDGSVPRNFLPHKHDEKRK